MSREELENRYRQLIGVSVGKVIPALSRMPTYKLLEAVETLERELAKARASRAGGDIERLREAQAETVLTTDNVSEWLVKALREWDRSGSSIAFYPFHGAVELYGEIPSGLAAVFERLNGQSRLNFREGVASALDAILNTNAITGARQAVILMLADQISLWEDKCGNNGNC